jgi:hypothetical protein
MNNTILETRTNIICNHFVLQLTKINVEKHFKNNEIISDNPNDPNYISISEILEWSGENLCKTISKDYILEELESTDIVLLSASVTNNKTRSKQLSKKLCGFVLIKIRKDHLYISVICGLPGIGGKLIKKTETLAKKMNKKKIKLDSMDAPIGFYLKNGYLFDKGYDTYEISENYFPEYSIPKKISNPPPNYDKNGNKIDIGYIYTEAYGGHRYHWIIIQDEGIKRWKLIKPGYIFLNKIGSQIKNYLLTKKPSLLLASEIRTKAGTQRKYLNGGMITTLQNIKIKSSDEETKLISMTKKII